jgi:hypothetical protein
MRHVIVSAVIVIASGLALAQPLPESIPEQARPAYLYIKAILSDDLVSFSNAHTKVAIEVYKEMGGISNLFAQAKVAIPKKFENAELKQFTFTAERWTHATPGGPLELDGEYYMVMMNVEAVGGIGTFVEKETGQWRITIPRYKNLEELMERHKAMSNVASDKTPEHISEGRGRPSENAQR